MTAWQTRVTDAATLAIAEYILLTSNPLLKELILSRPVPEFRQRTLSVGPYTRENPRAG